MCRPLQWHPEKNPMNARPVSRCAVPDLQELPGDLRARILAVQEKSGLVPEAMLDFAVHGGAFGFRRHLRYATRAMERLE